MTPDQLTSTLTARLHGPHDDEMTAGTARLAAEAIRFLNYATRPHAGGLTEPATVPAVMGELSTAVYRIRNCSASSPTGSTTPRPPGNWLMITAARCTG